LDEAWTTTRHIYVAPLPGRDAAASGGEALVGCKITGLGNCLTADNLGYDLNPSVSPDGRMLAWLSMCTPQYEADAARIKVHDLATSTTRTLAADWDYSPGDLCWSRDGGRLLFAANIRSRNALCAINVASGILTVLVADGHNSLCTETADGQLVYKHSSLQAPDELWMCNADGTGQRQLTFLNTDALQGLHLGRAEELTFRGAHNEEVHAWLVRPAGFSGA